MSDRVVYQLLILVAAASVISLAIASVTFHRQTNTEILTPQQIRYLETLEDNVRIDNNHCVEAQCFTDQFLFTMQTQLQQLVQNTNLLSIIQSQQISVSESITFGTTTTLSPNEIKCTEELILTATNVQMGTLTPFTLSAFTTAERLSVTPLDGMMVFDTDLNQTLVYQNGSWSQAVLDGVQSVNGTAGQIDSTGGINPVISMDPGLYNSILAWQDIEPTGTPLNNQFLVYESSPSARLNWRTVGFLPFNSSRNIYVDKSGNDTTGDGSNIFPYLTIGKAITVALAGNTSLTLQTCILIGAGNYVEANPIDITKSGLNIIGSTQRGTMILPTTLSLPLFTGNNVNLLLAQLRFDVSGVSTSSALNFTGTYNIGISDCVFRGYDKAIDTTGAGMFATTLIVNDCTFAQNGHAIVATSCNMLVSSCSLTGTLIGNPPSSLLNGIDVTGSGTNVYITAGLFVRCGYCIRVSSNAFASVGSTSFNFNLTAIEMSSQAIVSAFSNSFSKMDTGHVVATLTDAGTKLRVSSCDVDGRDLTNVVKGTGFQISNEASMQMQACNISYCLVGILDGLVSDTGSTQVVASSSNFDNNTTSVHVQGTSTFFGVIIDVDDFTTMIFDSDQNVRIAMASFSPTTASFVVGTLANTITDVLGVATKLTDYPTLRYEPNLYSQESLCFFNPDMTVSSAWSNVAQLDSSINVVSRNIANFSQLSLYSDISSTLGDGNDRRGWNVRKTATDAELEFLYQNNIIGQAILSDVLVMRLNGVNKTIEVFDSTLEWSGGSQLYESAPDILTVSGDLVVGNLIPHRAVATDNVSQFISSITTHTELGYLSGTTSNVQTQLDGKLNLTGGTMSGALSNTDQGSATNPTFDINGGAGIYSSATNHFTIASNLQPRIDVDANGVLTFYDFTVAGVLHNDASGIVTSSLIVDGDITNLTISNGKLATQSSSNNANYIVSRDGSGNFAANMITLNTAAVINPTDATTKQYVDTAIATGFVVHEAVVVVSVADVALTGLQTIDGVLLGDNDRVLLIAQTAPIENGAWEAHAGVWTRPTDFDTGDAASAAYFLVTSGTIYTGSSYVCTTPTAIIDTDPIQFAQFSLPAASQGANDGTGQGLVFSNVSGNTLHFRSLLEQTYVNIVNDTNEIKIGVDADTASAPFTLVARDGSGNFSAGTITASLTGAASLNLLLVGGTLSGALQIPNGSFASPSLRVGSTNTGLSNSGSDDFQISTNNLLRMSISSAGTVTIPNLSANGVVHTNLSGLLTTSKLVDGDITLGTIANDKLAAIDSANTPSTIVMRDSSGNFSAGTISANLTGNVSGNVTGTLTGHATLDLALTGGTMSGNILLPTGNAGTPALQVGLSNVGLFESSNGLFISTNGTEVASFSSAGTFRVNNLSTGLVHSGATGIFTSSLLVDADITNATISNAKLAAISSTNTAGNIVVRDGSGNFAAGAVTVSSLTSSGTISITAAASRLSFAGDILVGSGTTGPNFRSTVVGMNAVSNSQDEIILGYNTISSATGGANILIGPNATLGASASQAICLGNAASANFDAIVIGHSSSCAQLQSIVIGHTSTCSGVNCVVLGLSNTASATSAHCLGIGLTNSTANSLLIGDASFVNIRAASTICDLGTPTLPFKMVWVNDGIDSTTSFNIGTTNATSIAMGRSGISTFVSGVFATTISHGAWYSTSNFNPSFNANQNRLTPPSAATAGNLVDFTHSLGVLTYTGTRTRSFFISYNITFTTSTSAPPPSRDMTFFNSINGSTTIGTQTQMKQGVNTSTSSLQMNLHFSDIIVLANGNTVQLGGACASTTGTVAYNLVSCNIYALPN